MKKTTVLLLLLLSFVGYSQQKQFQINWDGDTTISTGSFSIQLPSFNPVNFSYDLETGLKFVSQWELNTAMNEESARLENVTYSSISKSELKGLDISTLPNQLQFELHKSVARNKTYGFLEVSPIIKDGENGFKKVTSFNLVYSTNVIGRSNNRVSLSESGIYNSVLASGEWFQFYVDTTGVYKLSKSFLEDLGVNVDKINPKQLKVFGNGGRMIPYSNDEPQYYDIQENAIQVVGEEDGSFDNNDYILFYAIGPNEYNVESNTNINCYTFKTSYFIQVSANEGKRIKPFINSDSPADAIIETHQTYLFHETDEYNLAQVGRRWFGDRFDVSLQKSFKFEVPDIITTAPIAFRAVVAATSDSSSSFEVSFNGASQGILSIAAANGSSLANGADRIWSVLSSSSEINVNLTYDKKGNPSALGYIDFISLEATRALSFYGEQFGFYNNEVASMAGIVEYRLENASQVSEIWNVTNPFSVSSILNSTAESTFSFKRPAGQTESFVALTSSDYYSPTRDSNTRIENQNLKGTIFENENGDFEAIDYIIVSPTNFYAQAERLAGINNAQYGLNVKVVTLDAIYNEFSTGNEDIAAIRNFIKYVYDNGGDSKIKYLCMFGDTSYDYKNRISNDVNYVPSWNAYNSFSLTNSYISDDFYGMMGDTEGDMSASNLLDISLGRIVADSPSQVAQMVDKIERYYDDKSYGSWRNSVVMVSDDVDESWEVLLENTTNEIADSIAAENPFINVTKIHSDAYQQESSAGGDRYPEVNESMVRAMQTGALVVNYFGHGGEDGLAHERIFMKPDATELTNEYKMNCLVTVTCSFTRFDNPLRETAGEVTFWNPDGGSISLLTTTREIYAQFGVTFNTVLSEYLFSYNTGDSYDDTEYPTMAEALRLTKTKAYSSTSTNPQKYLVFYIGDPAMKLSIPKPNIKLTGATDFSTGEPIDQLKALGRVSLSGEVVDEAGNLLSDYTGVLASTIYDKEIERSTLGNDGTRVGDDVYIMDFTTLGEIIFRGQASVSQGKFQFDFVVPRDIGIPVGDGRVSFYSKSENPLEDQTGANETIKVGGINENAAEDNTGPVLNLYMNDENFVSGGITNQSPSLLLKLFDENGINTASGIGHDIVAVIDGDETNPYVLNDYYQTEVDDYKNGIVSYPFRDLEAGMHTLSVKAWDVYNNSSITEIQFVVYNENESLVISNVLNYPNPFVNYTEFWFNHNSSGPLDVSIQIFTVSGKLVRTINGQTNTADSISGGASTLSRDIVWDGRDDFGDKIGKGTYVYILKVKSVSLNKTVEKIEKLVIL